MERERISPRAALALVQDGAAGTCGDAPARPWAHVFTDAPDVTRASRCRSCDRTLGMLLGCRYDVAGGPVSTRPPSRRAQRRRAAREEVRRG